MALDQVTHPSGCYKFLPALHTYSAGVVASPGYKISALRLPDSPTMAAGFSRIDEELERRNLRPEALVGVHLRSPGAFTFDEFANFNAEYQQMLEARSLMLEGVNPISRTNVMPIIGAPKAPSICTAFIVIPSKGLGGQDFVVAGAGEIKGVFEPGNIVARGDLSPKGLSAKVSCVLEILIERLTALGAEVDSPTTINAYTIHEISKLTETIGLKIPSIFKHGYTHWLTTPPVKEIEFEMDCLSVSSWHLI